VFFGLWYNRGMNVDNVQRETGLVAPAGNRLHCGLLIRRRRLADWPSAIQPTTYLFSVAQTSKSAVSRVSKPAGRTAVGPTWKSAVQQVWKPALQKIGLSTPNRYPITSRRYDGVDFTHFRAAPPPIRLNPALRSSIRPSSLLNPGLIRPPIRA
jgi:hypothetical protein